MDGTALERAARLADLDEALDVLRRAFEIEDARVAEGLSAFPDPAAAWRAMAPPARRALAAGWIGLEHSP